MAEPTTGPEAIAKREIVYVTKQGDGFVVQSYLAPAGIWMKVGDPVEFDQVNKATAFAFEMAKICRGTIAIEAPEL